MSALQEIWNGFNFSELRSVLVRVIPALICITLHELSHGAVALALGDTTARDAGRLTLNPIKHLDPMGLLMMVIFGFGYAKPVPVNMMKFRNPKGGMALTALAGPVSNVLIAVLFFFLYGFLNLPLIGSDAGSLALEMLITTAYLSMAMAIFNLLPIPPLDGSKVLFALLPEEAYWKLMRYERYGFALLALLLFTGVIDGPLNWMMREMSGLLFPAARAGLRLANLIF